MSHTELRKRYVLVGASSRSLAMFVQPMVQQFQMTAELVGIYDPNQTRAAYVAQAGGGIPVFADVTEMLRATRPDCVIVATIDRVHHEYIIQALEAGCDAITEKPMTINAANVRAILAAEQRTGRKVVVTFNYRYRPDVTRVKELIRSGVIGTPLSVDFHWMLDTVHGADYFRRWHRRMEHSGGLLVHKATHHFDMVNWWLDDLPQQVSAFGARHFYGPTRAERGVRCSTCDYQASCEFAVRFYERPDYQALYFAAEHEDGYYRDGCVFADDIDIYDTMSVAARYAGGALLSYSLNAHSPYEGWKAAINGTAGRIEVEEFESGPLVGAPRRQIRLFNRLGELVTYEAAQAAGGHGGGDMRLLQHLFGGKQLPDPLGHQAGAYAGALSALLGIAANQSIAAQHVVNVQALLEDGG